MLCNLRNWERICIALAPRSKVKTYYSSEVTIGVVCSNIFSFFRFSEAFRKLCFAIQIPIIRRLCKRSNVQFSSLGYMRRTKETFKCKGSLFGKLPIVLCFQ